MTAVERLRDALGLDSLRGAIICREAEIRWVTGGFEGEGLVLVTGRDAFVFTDNRWSEAPGPQFRTVRCEGSLIRALAEQCLLLGLERLYYPEEQLPVSRYRRLRDLLDGEIAMLPMGGHAAQLRAVKQEWELERISQACRITCEGFGRLLPQLREGITERRAAELLNAAMFDLGADRLAFPTMVAFGEDTRMCHFRPGERPLRSGDAVQVDAGATVGGYCADFSRMLCLGTPEPELIRLHAAVRKTLEDTIAALKPGTAGGDIDLSARRSLEEQGIDSSFPHAAGHGLGLNIHEYPSLSVHSRDIPQPGMTVALEPAVYTDRLGVRLEDTMLLTEKGAELLTDYPRGLIIL